MTLFEIKIQLPARERAQGAENTHEKKEQWGHFFAPRGQESSFEVGEEALAVRRTSGISDAF